MGAAEIIACEEVCARKQGDTLRPQLHARFAQGLDTLEPQGHEPPSTLLAMPATVGDLRQQRTGGLTETIVAHGHRRDHDRTQGPCPKCSGMLQTRARVCRMVETMGGPVRLARPYFYWRPCHFGCYPFAEAVGVVAGGKQRERHKAATTVGPAVPYDTAQERFHALTGIAVGSERLHTAPHQRAQELTVLAVAPAREESRRRVAAGAAGRWRRPGGVLGMDGAYGPTRPDSARERRPGRRGKRAKRALGRGQWRDAKGFRFYLLDGDRLVHLLRWPQVHKAHDLGEALQQVRAAGLLPEEAVRLWGVADGAEWR